MRAYSPLNGTCNTFQAKARYEFDVENSMFRPIDGFVQNGYNIIEIIIIQIILSKR